jgi:FixJ family two-component response regulator
LGDSSQIIGRSAILVFVPIPERRVSGDVHEAQCAEEHGLQNFLRKPVDPEVLLQAIARQCEK